MGLTRQTVAMTGQRASENPLIDPRSVALTLIYPVWVAGIVICPVEVEGSSLLRTLRMACPIGEWLQGLWPLVVQMMGLVVALKGLRVLRLENR